MSNEDLRGDLGAQPDAHWSTFWSTWTHEKVQEYLAGFAAAPPMSADQCEQLIQGLPPFPNGWAGPPTCLEDFETSVDRFRDDMKRGKLPKNPTPMEFAAWCKEMNVELPSAFVEALPSAFPVSTAPAAAAAQSAAPTQLPGGNWFSPVADATPAAKPRKSPAGRKPGASLFKEAMLKRGKELVMHHACNGLPFDLRTIARELLADPVCGPTTEESIFRQIKGQLNIEQAKATAARVKSRSKAKKND